MLTGFAPDETVPWTCPGDTDPRTTFRIRALSDGRYAALRRRALGCHLALGQIVEERIAAEKRLGAAGADLAAESRILDALTVRSHEEQVKREEYHREVVRWGCAGHAGGAGGLASCGLVEVEDEAGRKVKVLSEETLSVYARTNCQLPEAEPAKDVAGGPRVSLLELLAEAVMAAQRIDASARRELHGPRMDAAGGP